MATRCVDVSENKRYKTTSPIAVMVFVFLFVLQNIFMDASFAFVIVAILLFVFTQIFFQYKPRFIFLGYIYLTKNSYLRPSNSDPLYIFEEEKISNIAKVLNEYDLDEKTQKKVIYNQKLASYKNYLDLKSREKKGK